MHAWSRSPQNLSQKYINNWAKKDCEPSCMSFINLSIYRAWLVEKWTQRNEYTHSIILFPFTIGPCSHGNFARVFKTHMQGISQQCQTRLMGWVAPFCYLLSSCHKILISVIHIVPRISWKIVVNQMSKKMQLGTNVVSCFSTGDRTIRQRVQRRSVNIVSAFELAFDIWGEHPPMFQHQHFHRCQCTH